MRTCVYLRLWVTEAAPTLASAAAGCLYAVFAEDIEDRNNLVEIAGFSSKIDAVQFANGLCELIVK